METLICILIIVAGIWLYNFIKIVDRPADPKEEAEFWQLCFFTEYWRGPTDKF